MNIDLKGARMSIDGIDIGPIAEGSFTAHEAAVASTDLASCSYSASCTTVVDGAAGRALCRFIRGVRRACTPYAPNRGLKKPRGRRGKARRSQMWMRALERGWEKAAREASSASLAAIICRGILYGRAAANINERANEIMQADRGLA